MNNSHALRGHIKVTIDQVAYRDGGGPPGMVSTGGRTEMIAGLYRPAPVPAWAAVAEEALRVHMRANNCTTYYLPPPRRPGKGEAHIYAILKGLAEWTQEGGSANGTPAVAAVREEAFRRLAPEEWFEGSPGDISYLWGWGYCALVPLGQE